MTPEPGAVLRVCCHLCKQQSDEPREWAKLWFCPPCHKSVRVNYWQAKINEEIQRHSLEKDFHERKIYELRDKLAAVEAEGKPDP